MNSVSVVLTHAERAARLHAYISRKYPRFSPESASRVVALVEPHWHEPVKSLARHVRAALVAQGMDVGHQSVLQATARLQGHADYFHAPRKPNALEIFVHGVASQALPVADWRACANLLVNACERWLGENHLSRLLRLDISPRVLCVYGMVPGSDDVVGGSDPIAMVRPLLPGVWLEGAGSALETLRRRVEESQRAILDGLALVRFCGTRADAALPYSLWGGAKPADTPYSELVLLRQDHDLDEGYEIVRGDEIACWQQLLKTLESRSPADIAIDEIGAWICGGARFVWEVATLRPHEYVPGLARSNLPADESRHLLRRFQAAHRTRVAEPVEGHGPKRIAEIVDPPATCKLDAHRVLHALHARGQTWETFCQSIGVEAALVTRPIDLGLFLALATHLEHPDPGSLLLRPTRSELEAVHDDQLLRALMPRLTHVRYRIPVGLGASHRAAVEEAVANFATSIALRNGVLPIQPALPDAVYSGDGEELRLALESIGLVMYVGLIPFLKMIPTEMRQRHPQLGAYAYGTSLYVDIDAAA